MTLTVAALADPHFGPRAMFANKLRKMGDAAPFLTEQFVERMNRVVRPDLVLTLGDLIEHESLAADQERYARCLDILSRLAAPVRHVAGNHDSIHLSDSMLRKARGHEGELYYSFDCGTLHCVVLRTVEHRDLEVRLSEEQMEWLRADLEGTSYPTLVAMHHGAADQDVAGNPWFEHAPHLALVRERRELRAILAASGKVILVLNGHLHWNHVDLHNGIPYVTVQSLVENVEDDAPGRVAAAHAVVRVSDRSLLVTIDGACPTRYEHHFATGR